MSIFHTKQKVYIQYIYGLLAVLIIWVIATLVFLLVRSQSVLQNTSDQDAKVETSTHDAVENISEDAGTYDTSDPYRTATELRAAYTLQIEELRRYIREERDTMPVMLSQVEERLLAIRVPAEMRDPHLAAVIAIVTLRTDVGERTEDDSIAQLDNLLATLVQK